jgi:hypothetical protein
MPLILDITVCFRLLSYVIGPLTCFGLLLVGQCVYLYWVGKKKTGYVLLVLAILLPVSSKCPSVTGRPFTAGPKDDNGLSELVYIDVGGVIGVSRLAKGFRPAVPHLFC